MECLIVFVIVALLCAGAGDLVVELARIGAVRAGILREELPLPGLNWLGASAGVALPIAVPVAICAMFSDNFIQTWVFGTVWLAAAAGAVVDLPLSVARNWWAGRSRAWMALEGIVLAMIVVLLVGGLFVASRQPPRGTSWGAPA